MLGLRRSERMKLVSLIPFLLLIVGVITGIIYSKIVVEMEEIVAELEEGDNK